MEARAARNLAKARADLAALGVDFTPHTSDSYVTVYRADRILGTAMRRRVYSNAPAWSFHPADDSAPFEARSEFAMVKALTRFVRQMDASGSANA
jgi:hypothetical protein